MKSKLSLAPSSSTHIKSLEPNFQSQILPSHSSQAIHHDTISDLYSKFVTINRTVVVEHDESSLNIIDYETHEDRKKYDYEQMMIDKLKKIQNMAEIKRANQELERRENKLRSMKKHVDVLLPEEQNYLTSFKRFNENNKQKLFNDEVLTDSEEEDITSARNDYQGIHYYHLLKRHPKILVYTLQKIKSRQLSVESQKKNKIQQRQAFKKQIKKLEPSAILALKPKKIEVVAVNPQTVYEDIYKKLYTKKGKRLLTKDAKKNVRLSKFISQQNQIVETIQGRSLSKQSIKKLKDKFSQIVNQMYMGEKRKRQSSLLPKLSATSTIKFNHQ